MTPTVCTLNKVLVDIDVDIAGTSTTELDVRALGYCHKSQAVANALKFANPEKIGKVAIYTRLSHPDNGVSYRRMCCCGLLKSICTKDEGNNSNDSNMKKIRAPITLLMCFVSLVEV